MSIIAFIHIEKTAGKAIKHQLRRGLGVSHCDVKRWRRKADYFSAADLRRLLRIYPWLRSIAGHSIKAYSDLKTDFSNIDYYTFLRDPIQRSISHYQYRRNLGTIRCSFEDWIQDEANHDWQVRTLAGAPDLDRAMGMIEREISFIGLQERLDESLSLMERAFGLGPVFNIACERVNAAKNNSIRDRVVGESRNLWLLEQANRLDLELYRYAETVIYPRQQRQFGAALDQRRTAGANRSLWQRYVHGNCPSVVYRELVYRPIVWLYRRAWDRAL